MFKNIFKKSENNNPINEVETIKTSDDEFFKWLTFANVGWLHPGNAYCMDYAVKRLPTDNPIVEIGSFAGLSTNVISYLLKKYSKPNKFINSDPWVFAGLENGNTIGDFSDIKQNEYREFVIDSFKRNVNFFSKGSSIHTVEASSDEFFHKWGNSQSVKDIYGKDLQLGGKISFAYIDGDHTYEAAKRDFLNVSNYLDKGGFILFDDSSDNIPFPCANLMPEVLANPDYELVMKNPNYLFRRIR